MDRSTFPVRINIQYSYQNALFYNGKLFNLNVKSYEDAHKIFAQLGGFDFVCAGVFEVEAHFYYCRSFFLCVLACCTNYVFIVIT